jgi:Mn-dependent DtxR family transcriptional regulator
MGHMAKGKEIMEGFYTSVQMAGVFFRYCLRYKIETREEKIKVWERLAKKQKAMFTDSVENLHKSLKDKSN